MNFKEIFTLLIPVAHAQSSGAAAPQTFKDWVDYAVQIINILVPAIFALTVLVFLWGIFRYVFAGGSEDDMKNAKQIMLWGVILLAVMVGTWGILNLLRVSILQNVTGF